MQLISSAAAVRNDPRAIAPRISRPHILEITWLIADQRLPVRIRLPT